ncbi:hypothetical protein H9L19_01000 [Weissella diestrammenae]|uniref:Uncharacterized protein n=1 Tax=Weissella diestrammenae TaxID=1162633 RepID=A0A7G9T5Y8_9LACO|nr:hypothetical protein [Weissella diestrammenae]MCM0582345.1 hypothetical protein [Weissella diestrammenae]QNN75513.1 hypothetical protein H9L19_01000 [Weissella diestrammenae]
MNDQITIGDLVYCQGIQAIPQAFIGEVRQVNHDSYSVQIKYVGDLGVSGLELINQVFLVPKRGTKIFMQKTQRE